MTRKKYQNLQFIFRANTVEIAQDERADRSDFFVLDVKNSHQSFEHNSSTNIYSNR